MEQEVNMDDFASYSGRHTNEDVRKEAEELSSRYNGKSEEELTRDIFARAAEGKKNGTLTNEQIDAFYARFAPMLDAAKRKKLSALIERLKRM